MYNTVCRQYQIIKQHIQSFLNEKDNRMIVFWLTVFALAAHLYRWSNSLFNHDSLLIIQNDHDWQVSLGRFLIPVYVGVRGELTVPIIIGILAMFYLGISVFLMADLLDIHKLINKVMLGGILATYATVVHSFATFLPWADVYMLSLLFAVLAVRIYFRYGRKGIIPAAVLTVVSLGLYPAYFAVSLSLVILRLIKQSLTDVSPADVLSKGIGALVFMVAGGVTYLTLWHFSLDQLGLAAAQTANSIGNIYQFQIKEIPDMVVRAYHITAHRWLFPDTFHAETVTVCNILLLVFSVCAFTGIVVKKGIKKVWPVFPMILILPLCMSSVGVIAGFLSNTMTFSFSLLYWASVMVLELSADEKISETWLKLNKLTPVLLLSVILSNIVYANQMYLKKDLEAQSTLAAVNRLVYRMESVEGFIPGETTVLLIGDMNYSSVLGDREFPDYLGRNEFGPTYYEAYENYFKYILAYPVNLGSQDMIYEYMQREDVINMPSYPSQECCRMIEGVLVVKMSDNMN